MFPSSDDDGKSSSKLKTSASSSIQVHRWWKLWFTLKTLFLWLACLQLGCNRPVRPNVQFNETLKTHSASLGLVQLFRRHCSKDHFCTFASIKPLVNCLAPPSVRYSYSLCSPALTACHQLLSIFGAPPIFSLCFYVTIVGGQSGTSLVARGTGTTEGRMAPGRGHHGTTPRHTGSIGPHHPDPPALCVRRHLEPALFPSFQRQCSFHQVFSTRKQLNGSDTKEQAHYFARHPILSLSYYFLSISQALIDGQIALSSAYNIINKSKP